MTHWNISFFEVVCVRLCVSKRKTMITFCILSSQTSVSCSCSRLVFVYSQLRDIINHISNKMIFGALVQMGTNGLRPCLQWAKMNSSSRTNAMRLKDVQTEQREIHSIHVSHRQQTSSKQKKRGTHEKKFSNVNVFEVCCVTSFVRCLLL